MRIGHGYDVHRLVEDRKLIMGAWRSRMSKGLLGHSRRGCAAARRNGRCAGRGGAGDIGQHFPDNDPAYKGADSLP